MNYDFLINDMTWSYSRVSSFEMCPYGWYLNYLNGIEDEDRFFSQFGSYMHYILEQYYSGKMKKYELSSYFMNHIKEFVTSYPPNEKILKNYMKQALEHFKSGLLEFDEILETELKVNFELEGKKFFGFIDLTVKDKNDIIVIDHKSRALKEYSKRKKPTKVDIELNKYLRQLYLYSIGIKEIYGKYPKKLCFNCFRENRFIEVPFDLKILNQTKRWVLSEIEKITKENDWNAIPEYFKCRYICGKGKNCEYCSKQ